MLYLNIKTSFIPLNFTIEGIQNFPLTLTCSALSLSFLPALFQSAYPATNHRLMAGAQPPLTASDSAPRASLLCFFFSPPKPKLGVGPETLSPIYLSLLWPPLFEPGQITHKPSNFGHRRPPPAPPHTTTTVAHLHRPPLTFASCFFRA